MNVRLNNYLLLISCSLSILLYALRLYLTESIHYFFLNWNLFLAILPLFIIKLSQLFESDHPKTTHFIGFSAWLLFFPNAPYILTDLIHLKQGAVIPIWFDLVLILSYAFSGLIAGFISLFYIHQIIRKYFSESKTTFIITSLLFLSAFGIYLGRFLRWNSWDIVHRPLELFTDIGHRFIYPFDHPRTWLITLSFGVFLNLIYWFSIGQHQQLVKKKIN